MSRPPPHTLVPLAKQGLPVAVLLPAVMTLARAAFWPYPSQLQSRAGQSRRTDGRCGEQPRRPDRTRCCRLSLLGMPPCLLASQDAPGLTVPGTASRETSRQPGHLGLAPASSEDAPWRHARYSVPPPLPPPLFAAAPVHIQSLLGASTRGIESTLCRGLGGLGRGHGHRFLQAAAAPSQLMRPMHHLAPAADERQCRSAGSLVI